MSCRGGEIKDTQRNTHTQGRRTLRPGSASVAFKDECGGASLVGAAEIPRRGGRCVIAVVLLCYRQQPQNFANQVQKTLSAAINSQPVAGEGGCPGCISESAQIVFTLSSPSAIPESKNLHTFILQRVLPVVDSRALFRRSGSCSTATMLRSSGRAAGAAVARARLLCAPQVGNLYRNR